MIPIPGERRSGGFFAEGGGLKTNSETILVTGGAGYIGSHTCLALAARGYTPVVYDDLSGGFEEFVRWGPFERGSLLDADRLREVIGRHRPVAAMHFASLILVGESALRPLDYYRVNALGTLNLLESLRAADVRSVVFSSTCATYGDPLTPVLTEDHPQSPISPYGRSKLAAEGMILDCGAAHGLTSAILRYFNASGADPEGRIGEDHRPETHLIPLLLHAASGSLPEIEVFGTDYDTADGTCVRDFIHVVDLADAHVRALERLLGGGESFQCNLGSGAGHTVREVIAMAERVTGRPIPTRTAPRRPGDAPSLVADISRAGRLLGWSPRRSDTESILRDAWSWHEKRFGASDCAPGPSGL